MAPLLILIVCIYVWVGWYGVGLCSWGSVLVKVDAAVGKLAEGSLLLDFGGLLGVLKWR
jgi:hypothetical protein